MLISATKFCGLQVMEVQLHGVGSFEFQSEREGGGEGEEVCSHAYSVEASLLGGAAAAA